MDTFPSLFLYSLTIQNSNYVQNSCVASLSGKKVQEIVIATESRLLVYKVDPNDGRISCILNHNCFGIIRNVAPLRLTGFKRDYLIVTSDSGRITVLQYDLGLNKLVPVYQEAFGKSGIRRVVPGEYLAVDAKGRAAMVASVEKSKLVYVLNRDSEADLTISSPLEAHKAGVICFSLVGLDTGYANPIFAALEVDYSDIDHDQSGQAYENVEKVLTYYELDLGLNHVVRRWSKVVDRSSYMLLSVPGGNDGPSGTLVISEGWISYRHLQKRFHQIPIMRRKGNEMEETATPWAESNPENKDLRLPVIVSAVMHRMKGSFFYLLQTHEGDLLKLTVEHDGQGNVNELRMKYFDTIPLSVELNILKTGFLFISCEGGNHQLYQFENLGLDDGELEISSLEYPDDFLVTTGKNIFYQVRGLQNLSLVDEVPCLYPVTDSLVVKSPLLDDPTQIYAISGRGNASSLRRLKRGLETTEIVASEIPGAPVAIWTLKLSRNDVYDSYIILSFTNGTLVLSIGETVEEVSDSGLLSSVSTLNVHQMGQDSVLQVYSKGIRHIRSNKQISEWKLPADLLITQSTINDTQIVIALNNGELVYFEMSDDVEGGQLNEYQERKTLTANVTALALGPVPEGSKRSNFLCIACDDATVRVLSLDLYTTLESLSVQALSSPANSLCIIPMAVGGYTTLYLHIGLMNGVYLRTVVDVTSGQLLDTRTRFLGPKPVKLYPVSIKDQKTVLAVSTRAYLAYSFLQNLQLSPISYSAIEHISSFASEQCPQGVVAVHHNVLKIFTIDSLQDDLKSEIYPLMCTPRKLVKHPELPILCILQSERNFNSSKNYQDLGSHSLSSRANKDLSPLQEREWSSYISIFDLKSKQIVHACKLGDNEAAFCVEMVYFKSKDELFLVTGSATDVNLETRACSHGNIRVYRLKDEGTSLELVSHTETDDIPMCLRPFQGRMLAGVGKHLRMYELGNKKVLRKCEIAPVPLFITRLDVQGSRIVVGDSQCSIRYVVYKHDENRFLVFADDPIQRWCTTSTMVDYDTVAGGDKFGNMWLLRCPADISRLSDEDNSASKLLHEKPFLNSTPHKLELLSHFYTNDIPTSMKKVQLVEGAREVLLWTGLLGTVGVFTPFINQEDVRFFQQIEFFLRKEVPLLSGRDHLAYRSYYAPVKGVIDGDLCEMYYHLPREKQEVIASELDRTVAEISKKIEDFRVRSF
ncbi:U2 snRNP-associated protein, WD repeat protein Sap130 [Schizosaccharomyces osmophilus]|uniref:U2 snRNP-associated protein, WD repeat protein Sap130 n=1 Tax=Schizosaccharomyces osmophilus TaxID=2545709 RepID=A0AAF0AXQ4_9SCHI|nr:U2 snRNP-associated protein, WD repeat protein Sap130 [Schizosaccharomyces osmophilus]WBW74987.1 U2 snRNP-associated protein, WD repeat protein Sap130 [Schizosaccharomyces osmophilus]